MSRNRITGDALTTAALPAASGGTYNEGLVDDILAVPAGWAAGVHTVTLNGSIVGQPRPGDGDQIEIMDPLGLLAAGSSLVIQGRIAGLGKQIADQGVLADSIALTLAGSGRLLTFSNALDCWVATGRAANFADVAAVASSVFPVPPAGPLTFADFFALMPGDNAATIAVGAPMLFPQNGPASAAGITRSAGPSPSSFVLAAIGTYKIDFQVSVTEPGQLQLELGGAIVANSTVGRATGTNQIHGTSLVTTTVANTTLRVLNPAGNAAALTITPIAGGASAVSAHLVILKVA